MKRAGSRFWWAVTDVLGVVFFFALFFLLSGGLS